MSEEAAQAAGWKTQLVPGLLTLSIALGLLTEAGYTRDIMAIMGSDEVRFNAPVYPYDAIRVEGELLSKRRTSKGNWVGVYSLVVKNQHNMAVAQAKNLWMSRR